MSDRGRKIVLLKASAEQHADEETKRKKRLFAWADEVLRKLGFTDKVSKASNAQELHKIVFDANAAEVALAIRDALHPASGSKKADHFIGLKDGSLKQLLKSRFNNLKKEREDDLMHGRSGAGGTQSAYDWTAGLKVGDKGIRPILANLVLFLRFHPEWKDVLAYDEFNARVVIRKRPPWGDEAPDTSWTDHHESLMRVWFQHEDINATLGDVGRAVQTAAKHNCFHPVREYLDTLTWDGTPRIDSWLSTYLHAADTEYARAVGPRFLISAVARIYQPGCKVDHMPVLEGPQGKLKSETLRTLAVRDGWFTDRLSHVASKDAAQEVAGIWLAEFAEMDALTRATNSAAKSFITRRHDRFRPHYGKHPITLSRQCVFAGTINPVVGGYLKDPTGARRFWPVACQGMIDRDGIERDRDQIWAEARVRYKAGAKWYLETPELEALATAEQALRYKSDPWREPIEKWLGERKDVSIPEVLAGAFRPSIGY